jgi:CspA family cold shock protein
MLDKKRALRAQIHQIVRITSKSFINGSRRSIALPQVEHQVHTPTAYNSGLIITIVTLIFQASHGQKDSIMPTGTVKWFNNAKGYGFILSDEGGEDLFAHYSAITMDGYKTLKAGQAVSFDVTKGDKGLHAVNIKAPENTTESASQTAGAAVPA